MLVDVEGGGRVRLDEKAGEEREGWEEKNLVEWREMGRCCQQNLIFCKINLQATFHQEHTTAGT